MTLRRRLAIALLATAGFGLGFGPSPSAAQEAESGFPRRLTQPGAKRPVVTAVAIDGDVKYVAAAGDDHLIRIRRIDNLQEVARLKGHTDWIKTLEFAPQGEVLVSAGNDGRIIFWNLADGTVARQIACEFAIARIAFRPDGRYLAAVGFGNELRLYDTENKQAPAIKLRCPCGDMRALCFSADGKYLAAGGRDGAIRVWLASDYTVFADRTVHRRRIRDMIFLAARLVSVSEDTAVHVWPIAGSEEPFRLTTPSKIMSLASYAPDRIVTGGSDNRLRFWDLQLRKQIGHTQEHTGTIAAIASREQTVASGGYDTTLRLINAVDVEKALRGRRSEDISQRD